MTKLGQICRLLAYHIIETLRKATLGPYWWETPTQRRPITKLHIAEEPSLTPPEHNQSQQGQSTIPNQIPQTAQIEYTHRISRKHPQEIIPELTNGMKQDETTPNKPQNIRYRDEYTFDKPQVTDKKHNHQREQKHAKPGVTKG